MLIAAKSIYKCSIAGTDGTVGTVKDLLFDGQSWQMRYFDIDTGRWLPGRRVILSPEVIRAVDYAGQKLATPLTREQVKNSPPLESDLPVSRRKEIELADYYSWGVYWANIKAIQEDIDAEGDPNLRSARAVSGYRIQATDGEIGHVDDFIIDDETREQGSWGIRYLVIVNRNWLPDRAVLIPPLWAESIDWEAQHVHIDLTREMIENSPEYDPDAPINRQYEEVFYDYYGRPRYWKEV